MPTANRRIRELQTEISELFLRNQNTFPKNAGIDYRFDVIDRCERILHIDPTLTAYDALRASQIAATLTYYLGSDNPKPSISGEAPPNGQDLKNDLITTDNLYKLSVWFREHQTFFHLPLKSANKRANEYLMLAIQRHHPDACYDAAISKLEHGIHTDEALDLLAKAITLQCTHYHDAIMRYTETVLALPDDFPRRAKLLEQAERFLERMERCKDPVQIRRALLVHSRLVTWTYPAETDFEQSLRLTTATTLLKQAASDNPRKLPAPVDSIESTRYHYRPFGSGPTVSEIIRNRRMYPDDRATEKSLIEPTVDKKPQNHLRRTSSLR